MSNVIFLDQLDGAGFEELSKKIFERQYRTNVIRTPLVGDGGKDLIINDSGRIIYVECKHYLNSSVIGRPIVQKLHSAMITDNADRGIIITSGTFSSEAVHYISDNNLPIELIDHDAMCILASRNGIELRDSFCSAAITESCLNPEGYKLFDIHLSNYLNRMLISYPKRASDFHKLMKRDLVMRSVYFIDYAVDSVFTTSIGVIHEEHARGSVMMMGDSGQIMGDEIASLIRKNELEKYDPNKHTFRIDNSVNGVINQISDRIKDYVQTKHTRFVHYYGRNNRSYNKECTPSKKDIMITNIDRVFIPFSFIGYSISGKRFSMNIIENNHDDFHIIGQTGLDRCEYCGACSSKGQMICNDCGKIVSQKHKHGFKCVSCGKTICIECAHYYRRFLLFKKIVCSNCSVNYKTKKYLKNK